ncbi:TlpA family protein disulfide reductase [Roseivirga misakiensis]|uniref:Thioredoxin domain-containing protein n=1 Tax=Roseivirga misakiensis TaxID=1563681 RepID=A0A1E5T019_9BACT|nr:TlpA disulfide reductase family protein [Roseivirga misakiensis]OEK04720.1 hypothetical protein BFP71_14830 [Roseivirga misakiensis]
MVKKAKYFYFLLLLLSFSQIHGQKKIEFPAEWKVITTQQAREPNRYGGRIVFYGPEGKIIDEKKVLEFMKTGRFTQDFYVDKEGKIVAMHVKGASEQQLKRLEESEANKKLLAASIGKPARPFTVTDLNGEEISLADLKGSVVAINFWFVGCKPCILEMPELNEIVEKHEGEDVKFVAVALDKKPMIDKFLSNQSFDYDIVPEGREIAFLYNIKLYPTHCIIDKNGVIQYFKSGYSGNTAKEVDSKISDLLKKEP